MDRKMKNVLQAFLRMLEALNQELGTMSRSSSFSDHEECIMLVDEIRLTCNDSLKNLHVLEQKLIASPLAPPSEG